MALRWQIVADFLVLALAFYALLRWARSARAMRIALGVVGLHALALLARHLDLVVTSWVLDAAAILATLVLLLVFQPELRRAFMRLEASRAPTGPASFGNPDNASTITKVRAIPGFTELFRKTFPAEPDSVTIGNWGKAIGAYERTLLNPVPL